MERSEAVELLKRLIELNLAEPSFVSLEKDDKGSFDLKLKLCGNLEGIRGFAAEKKLVLYEDTEIGICTVHKP